MLGQASCEAINAPTSSPTTPQNMVAMTPARMTPSEYRLWSLLSRPLLMPMVIAARASTDAAIRM